MSQTHYSEQFTPYIPAWLRSQIGGSALLPGQSHDFDATILYADLGGFTTLTAAFATVPEGAERLHDSLSAIYNSVLGVVASFGGDVAAIAGDAFTVWWPEVTNVRQARSCAEAMLAAVRELPPIQTPDGLFRPALRIGIAVGQTRAIITGLPLHGMYLTLSGAALHAAVAAEREARPGQVRLARGVPRYQDRPRHGTAPLGRPGEGAMRVSIDNFLPPTFAERLRIGALIAEYRRCVPMFASFTLPNSAAELQSLVAQVQKIVGRWGGWLNEVEIGDKGAVFVVLFGAPVAHGDDPLRAVGCCLELRAAGLIGRAGVTVGTLFVGAVGSSSRRVYTAQGPEMNLAARLMYMAEPGEILVSGRVSSEIAGRYQVNAPTLITVKGSPRPVPVSRVLSKSYRYGRAGEASLQRNVSDVALIGRHFERGVLERTVTAVLAGHTRVLFIEGESGIGKSTLAQLLVGRWLEAGHQGYSGECTSNSQELPFVPWRPILADICGIDEAEPLARQIAQINLALGLPAADTDSVHPATWAIVQLLGLNEADGSTAKSPAENAQETAISYEHMVEAAVQLLQRRLSRGPLLILIENLHWADGWTLALAAALLEASNAPDLHPLLLALSQRPISEQLNPVVQQLYQLPTAIRLTVSPLRANESHQLLRVLLNAREVPSALDQLVERHAQGQPLFIKEYVRALRERGLLHVDEGVARLDTAQGNVQPSETVQGIIQARVDRLDEATRLTLKVAAVVGRSFRMSLLQHVHPAQPSLSHLMTQLNQLVELQIIELEMEGPERAYRFKHGITHEVAYASLLFGQRRTLHAAVAMWYEQMYAEDLCLQQAASAVYAQIIYHYRRADDQEKLAFYARVAAVEAIRTYAHGPALEYLATMLALCNDAAERYDLLLLRVAVWQRLGEGAGMADDVALLEELAAQLDDPIRQAHASFCHALWLVNTANYDAAITVVRHGQTIARTIITTSPEENLVYQASLLEGAFLDLEGMVHTGSGMHEAAEQVYRAALEQYERLALHTPSASDVAERSYMKGLIVFPATFNVQQLEARCCNRLGFLVVTSDLDEAEQLHRRAFVLARKVEDWTEQAEALLLLSNVASLKDELSQAQQYAARSLFISRATGSQALQASVMQRLNRVDALRETMLM
ncbi:MAG: AAA family ATPase [Chloroflexaceae bacterium]|nr:AAA family ATPase [Chloroflexaceae bacterium]